MLSIRKAEDRFHTHIGWLESHHTFSFGDHYDPDVMGFRSLRVINDDWIAAGGGFPTHGHRDMEIISYVTTGALGHKDSMGNSSTIEPGDVQRMTAGRGVQHSERNVADTATHLLQIWIVPDRPGYPPSYEQKRVPPEAKRDRLALVASGRTQDPMAVSFHQDADLFATLLSPGARVTHTLAPGRHAWVHVVKGDVRLNDQAMKTGDGAAISDETTLTLQATSEAEVLLFDLA